MNILIEAAGSKVWGTLLPYLRTVSSKIVGLDIDAFSCGLYMVNQGYVVPRYDEVGCFEKILKICRNEKIELVLPSINEGLLEWAKQRVSLQREGIKVLISPPESIAICQDKWETYQFFSDNKIPTPPTSLRHEYDLVKPRIGRGGTGIERISPTKKINMEGYISQQFINGEEFSVDALCDFDGNVVYVVPRKRLAVESGLSVKGQVVNDSEIEMYVRKILSLTPFIGPIDIQCFKVDSDIFFTEINPRIAGGLSLSMAATENWFEAVVEMGKGVSINPVKVNYGLLTMRYLSDCIIHERDLLL